MTYAYKTYVIIDDIQKLVYVVSGFYICLTYYSFLKMFSTI